MGTVVFVLGVIVMWRIATKVMRHREGNIIDGFLAVIFPLALIIYAIFLFSPAT
jgi:hypothetical protein